MYMFLITSAIWPACSASSLGSLERCAIATSSGASSLGATEAKNWLGGRPSHAQSKRKEVRSGWEPASTLEKVLKLTFAAAAAWRRERFPRRSLSSAPNCATSSRSTSRVESTELMALALVAEVTRTSPLGACGACENYRPSVALRCDNTASLSVSNAALLIHCRLEPLTRRGSPLTESEHRNDRYN